MATRKPQLDQSETVDALPVACASEAAAVEFFEKNRWGDHPTCPECESADVYQMKGRDGKRNKDYRWRCRHCGRLYSIRTGMIFEESLIPLHKWARAMWEAASAKNGVSALEMSRKVQVSYKSALFMMNRIRYAMAQAPGEGPKFTGTIEADETYVGGRPRYPQPKQGPNSKYPKTPVFAIVERGGRVRAKVMPTVTSANVRDALLASAEQSCTLVTDDSKVYVKVGKPFKAHETVNHSRKEYVRRGDPSIHSNTVEGFFARVKRGINGTYHAVSPEHLHRYVDGFAFMYNTREMNDGERTMHLIDRAEGKRLMYKVPA
jgi:transposase-like protein